MNVVEPQAAKRRPHALDDLRARVMSVPSQFNLSASQTSNGDQRAVEQRDKVAAKMMPAQIAEAQQLAREWKPTK